MKGYKAFDRGMMCRGYQYVVGETYTHEGEISLCNAGFHFVLNPLDVLSYYPDIAACEFAEVEALGKTIGGGEDSKAVTDIIKIVKRISFAEIVHASIEYAHNASAGDDANNVSAGYRANNVSAGYGAKNASAGDYAKNASAGDWANNASTGDWANNASVGNYANNASTGNYAKNASTGNYSSISMHGKNSVGVAIGRKSKIKGVIGSWITLAEYDEAEICIQVKSAQIDGEKLKPDTFYTLNNGKFEAVNE